MAAMIKRAIDFAFVAVIFAVVTKASWAVIDAGPKIIQSVKSAYVAHAKANRK
jgi:hypothetical protein